LSFSIIPRIADGLLSFSAPGSPHSLGSVAMDESDSDASDDEGGNSKSKLSALTGLEREQHLAELAEQETERRRMAQLKGLLSSRAEASKSGKRKAASADLDDDENDTRSAGRRRAKRDEALQSLRERRVVKKRDAKKSLSRRSSGSRDAEGDSDYDVPAKADPPGEIAEYQRVRIGRTNFAEYCFYPDVESYFTGCFTRVCFSRDNVTGENQYRMTQIKGAFDISFPIVPR
jgi:RNA polymerase-associated protein RTF1